MLDNNKFRLCAFLLIGTLFQSNAEAIEESSAGEAPQKAKRTNRFMLEEVVVTAQHREESIRDVPIAITAYSSEQLDAKGVYTQVDLPKITPGLNFTASIGFPAIFLRGIGTNANVLADPLVVSYVDGVYFPDSRSQFQQFGTVDTIEVSKGPQGTLFGRNALGGVIAIKTKDPSFEEVFGGFSFSQDVFTGSSASRGAINYSAYLSVPVTDNFAFMISGSGMKTDTYWDIYDGPLKVTSSGELKRGRVDDGHGWTGKIKLLWEPTDRLTVRLNYMEFFGDDDQKSFSQNRDPSILLASVNDIDLFGETNDPRNGELDAKIVGRQYAEVYYGGLKYSSDWGDFEVLAAVNDATNEQNYDFDSTSKPVAMFDGVDEAGAKGPFINNVRNVELRYLTTDNTPDWFEMVSGIYLFDQEFGIEGPTLTAGEVDLSLGVVAGIEVPGLKDVYGLISPLGVAPQVGPVLGFGGVVKGESWAVYSQATFTFVDWLSITLGARYTEDRRWVHRTDQYFFINEETPIHLFHYSGPDGEGDQDTALQNSSNNPKYESTTENLDPKISFNFHLGDESYLGRDAMVYASYSEASIGDTFNVIGLFSPPQLAKGTAIEAFEIGIKTSILDGVDLEGAVFHYIETNAQNQIISLRSGGAVSFENAPELEVDGAELSLLGPIFPKLLNYGLIGSFGISYLDAVYTDYPSGTGYDSNLGNQQYDYTGQRVVQTPEVTYTASLNYTIDIIGGPLEIGVDYYYNDGFWYSPKNDDGSVVESYDLLGFNMSYLLEEYRTRISLYGRNIENSYYEAGIFENDFGTTVTPAPGATWGAKIAVEF